MKAVKNRYSNAILHPSVQAPASGSGGGSRLRGRIAFLGDSITATSLNNGRQWGSIGSWNGATVGRSMGRLRMVREAGVPGDTTTGMLARFDTDIAPYKPELVHVLAMTNDVSQSFTLALSISNYTAIVNKILALGATPILGTIPPRAAGALQDATVLRNNWLRQYAAANNFLLVDYYQALADPLTGAYVAAYTSDSVHPIAAGQAVMANTLLAALQPFLSPSTAYVAQSAADASNAFTNGFGATWAAAPTVPTISISKAATGSTLAAGTYFYKVGYVSYSGETLPSNEVSITAAAGDSITISCPVLTGWNRLSIYRGTASNAELRLDEVATVGATTNTYVDNGTKTPAAPGPATFDSYVAGTGWSPSTGGGTNILRRVTDTDFRGYAVELTQRGTVASAYVLASAGFTPAAGDQVSISFKVKPMNGAQVRLAQVTFQNGTSDVDAIHGFYQMESANLGNGVVLYSFVATAPANVTRMAFKIIADSNNLPVRVGEISAINLTAQGIVAAA